MVADDQRNNDEPEQSVSSDDPQVVAGGADSLADAPAVSEKAPESEQPVAGDPQETGQEPEVPVALDASGEEVIDASGGMVANAAQANPDGDEPRMEWYILKVQVNREDSIRDALLRRIKIEGLDEFVADVIVPVEELAEYTKTGKRRIVKRKLYPGYILVHMVINDDTWFAVRETPGVGDFTGSAGKPTPMDVREVERILRLGASQEDGAAPVKTAIPFRSGDRVRVKDGNFQNFEGEVDTIDEANGRIVVIINIFNRSTPVELEHWQVEAV